MTRLEEAKLAELAALSALGEALLDQLQAKVSMLTEELKSGRELSPQEAAGLRQVISDLCDLPGVLPPEG